MGFEATNFPHHPVGPAGPTSIPKASRGRPLRSKAVSDLVLLRHGESTWNAENRFTGWVDVDLTPKGEDEAKRAGRLLAEEQGRGLELKVVHTSVLTRAVRTADLALEVMA